MTPAAVDAPVVGAAISDAVIAETLGLAAHPWAAGEADELARLTDLVRKRIDEQPSELASFPRMAMRVLDQLASGEVQMRDLVSTITQDAAVSAALLRVANSPFYSRGIPVANVSAAVLHMGLTQVAEIAVGVAARSLYHNRVSRSPLFDDLWQRLFHRSMTVAFASGAVTVARKKGGAERAFTGGLFHDVGMTVALRALSELVVEKRVRAPSRRVVERVLDALHVPIGVSMITKWQLPDHVRCVCQHHHDHDLPAGPEHDEVHIVRLVSNLNALRVHPDVESALAVEVRQSCEALRLDRVKFLWVSQQVRDFADKVTAMFGVTDKE